MHTSVLFGPDGARVAVYRKIHLFDIQLGEGATHTESSSVEAGGSATLAETPLARVGMSVCYDLRFPGLYRALVHAGCAAALAEEVGPLISRAHLRRLASVATFPASHAALLERTGADRAVGVITNFDDTATAYEILARHGILPRLGAVVVSEAIGLRKPSPVLVRLALRELDVPAPDAVMIGDHAIEDVGAANAAGVDAIWIDKTGEGVTDGNPTPRWIVRSLLEVAPILG